MEGDAFSLVTFLLAGLLSGFCSSAPLGPINLWLIEAIIADTVKSLKWFLLGVILVDMAFASMAVWGYYKYVAGSSYLQPLEIGAGIFLLMLGVFSFAKLKKDTGQDLGASKKSPLPLGGFKHFMLGMTICGSNPGFLMFWLFVVNFINTSLDLTFTLLGNLIFVLGVGLGDGLWFSFLARLVKKGLNLAKPKILLGIRYAIAFAFLGFGVVTIWHGLMA